MRECHGNVYRIVGRARRYEPALRRKDQLKQMKTYSSVAGVITRIRHAVSIMFSDQLRDRHVLWVDGEHNTSYSLLMLFLKMEMG